MTLRLATLLDAHSIATVHVDTWRAAYRNQIPESFLDGLSVERREAFWKSHIASHPGALFVLEHADALVGFCDFVPVRDKDLNPKKVGEITALYVLPQLWRSGAGRKLCHAAIEEAGARHFDSIALWVLTTNNPARLFYKAIGFYEDGTTKSETIAGAFQIEEIRLQITVPIYHPPKTPSALDDMNPTGAPAR